MYKVSEYLDLMTAAGRTAGTIRLYRGIFVSFARFLQVPVEDLHNHLVPENLIKYAGSLKGYSGNTVRERLAILRAYYQENGIVFSGLKAKVLNARRRTAGDDKPLDLETLQKMMDITDERGRAFITLMVSTGMRPGEAAQLRLQDVAGDTVTIRNEIAKGGRGGTAYLHAEAREFLDIWLMNRDEFVRLADIHSRALGKARPDKPDLLFSSTYSGLNSMFKRLYLKVDGEKGEYRNRITPHSLRKYFRTQATQGGLHIDITERLMRHSGYLNGSYVRLTDEKIRQEFHKHESSLYITRADHRIQGSKLDALKRENAELLERLLQVEQKQRMIQTIDAEEYSPEEIQKAISVLKALQKTKA